jgi:NAD(P)-dependent dehydrogenase (short-subunit alcohol dehydrogenase family)
MKTALIIGASRGLGLEFVTQYLAAGWRVIATARKHDGVKQLAALGASAHQLDVLSPADFLALTAALKDTAVDVAIYNAGIFGAATTALQAIAKAEFDAVMHANVWGAMNALPAIAPAVARASGVFAFVSSTMGSIAKMSGPNAVVYRASKSALNAVVKAASLELAASDVTSFVLHPGWVKTDMGGPNADIAAVESVTGMRAVIAAAQQNGAAFNGGFFDYAGTALPW